MKRAGRMAAVIVAVLTVAACAPALREDPPGPDRPRLVTLEIKPRRVLSGCPFRIILEFEDPHRDVVYARAHWAHETGSRRHDEGLINLPIAQPALAGKLTGRAEAVLTVYHPGRSWSSVQVEDAAGRKSNVLDEWVLVDAQPASGPLPCAEG